MRVPYTITALLKFDASGYNIAANVPLDVFQSNGSTYATYYSSLTAPDPVAQPSTVDANGERTIWIEPGDYVIRLNNEKSWPISVVGSVAAQTTFISLTDTPSAFTGNANKVVKVNSGGNALIFADPDGVRTFNARTGAVLPQVDDYSAHYASKAQGTKADTALQPSDTTKILTALNGAITTTQFTASLQNVFTNTIPGMSASINSLNGTVGDHSNRIGSLEQSVSALNAGTLDPESVQDIIGAMVSGNSENGISVTYNDAAGKLDFTTANTPLLNGSPASYYLDWNNFTNKPQPTIAITGAVTGSTYWSTFGSHLNINTIMTAHTHTAAQVTDLTSSVRTIVGGMVSGNTETNISVTYDAGAGKLNFVAAPGGSAPSNYVTTDTAQTISGQKTFSQEVAAISFRTTSSIRDKRNISELSIGTEFDDLRPVRYTRISTGQVELGLIAEDVGELYPEAVTFDEDGCALGIDYSKLVSVLIAKVQQQEARLSELEEANLDERVSFVEGILH